MCKHWVSPNACLRDVAGISSIPSNIGEISFSSIRRSVYIYIYIYIYIYTYIYISIYTSCTMCCFCVASSIAQDYISRLLCQWGVASYKTMDVDHCWNFPFIAEMFGIPDKSKFYLGVAQKLHCLLSAAAPYESPTICRTWCTTADLCMLLEDIVCLVEVGKAESKFAAGLIIVVALSDLVGMPF